MTKVYIGNSYSRIENLTGQQIDDLKYLLSYTPETNYFAGLYTKVKPTCLLNKRGEFPTGLLGLVSSYLYSGSLPYCVVDDRTVPKASGRLYNLNLKVIPYQAQQEALNAAIRHSRGTIEAVTGSGKSLIMAMIINHFQVKTLIVVPNLTLKEQLTRVLTDCFGSLSNITVQNIDSKELQKPGNYDLLLIDEAHHVAAKTYRLLNKKYWNNIYYRFFLTATPFRSQESQNVLLESVAGNIIHQLSYQDGVKTGSIVPIEAYEIEAPKFKVTGNSWGQVYKQMIVDNIARTETIQQLLIESRINKIPTLCLVREIQHGKNISANGAFYFASGEDKESQQLIARFNKGEINILIGTVGVLGEGSDTKRAQRVIIAGMGKSTPQLMQNIGRVLRTAPGKTHGTVLLINDSANHKWGKTHFSAQKRILLEQYGVKLKKY